MREAVSRLINQVGRTVTYKRVTGQSYSTTTGINTVTYTDYALIANVRDYRPRELQGDVRIGDKKMQLAASDIAFTPQKDDNVVFDGITYNIIAIDNRFISEDAALYIMQLRGA